MNNFYVADDWLEVRSKVNFNDSLNNLIDLCVIPNCERSEECSFQLSLVCIV